MKIVNSNEFKEIIKEGLTVVDFYADWCGPCRMLAPVLEEVSEELNDVKFIKVNVDNEGELAANYEIHSIPSLMVFKNNKLVDKTLGYQSKDSLKELITKNR